MSILRKAIPAPVLNELWQSAWATVQPRVRACPACGNRMAEVPARGVHEALHVDVCTVCQCVWFDAGEYAVLPEMPRKTTWPESLSQEARERLALVEVAAIRERAARTDWGEAGPDAWWQWIPAVLGLPVEHSDEGLGAQPVVTWGVAALVTAVSVIAFADLCGLVDRFGLIPAQFERYGGLTFLTSFFLHGGWVHLVGNVYFLLVFGDNVEDRIGKGRFLLLLACAMIAGGVAHVLGSPASTLPCIGASGGISGVMSYYAIQFPKARVGVLMRYFVVYRWIRMPAYVLFLVWVALQCVGVWQQLSGFSHVSSLAHLGGAAVGLVFFLRYRSGIDLSRSCL